MYFVYLLKSKKHNKSYVGMTKDLEIRLRRHNQGYYNYTKRYLPWEIVYSEKIDTLENATKREKYLKSAAGRKWLKRVVFKN
ncbi:GIY-YIG nuclease family protein [Patescibacteria group bacterium]